MRVLVTGVKGQLGYDCMRELSSRGYTDIRGIDLEDLDITDEEAVEDYVLSYHPDVIMHNAAWTAVDKAERKEENVFAVNALGPRNLASAASKIGAKLVYISTDYVFSGEGDKPFEVDDQPVGESVYGTTKYEGEVLVAQYCRKYFIVRISWVFGINGNNFVKTMLRLGKEKESLSVVNDQIGSPTYTRDLARLLVDMIETEKYGTYHATNEGFCSWAEFAKEIFAQAKLPTKVNEVSTEEYRALYPGQAPRPLNSRLSKKSLDEAGFRRLPDWKDALRRYLEELGE